MGSGDGYSYPPQGKDEIGEFWSVQHTTSIVRYGGKLCVAESQSCDHSVVALISNPIAAYDLGTEWGNYIDRYGGKHSRVFRPFRTFSPVSEGNTSKGEGRRRIPNPVHRQSPSRMVVALKETLATVTASQLLATEGDTQSALPNCHQNTDPGHPGVAENPPVSLRTKGRLPAIGRAPRVRYYPVDGKLCAEFEIVNWTEVPEPK